MHTSQEARVLWCPHGLAGVMQSAGGPSAINDPSTEFRTNCVADQCAMWRWAEPLPERKVIADGNPQATSMPRLAPIRASLFEFVPYDPDEGSPACWVEPQEMAAARRCGFCGLAGRPASE